MTRLLGIVVIYALMFLAWTGAGLFLLIFPVRAGNLIHDSFGLYPEVRQNDHGRKTILRAIGVGLLAFAVHLAWLTFAPPPGSPRTPTARSREHRDLSHVLQNAMPAGGFAVRVAEFAEHRR